MILTLLTDFGLTDYYVGAVKGTVLRLTAPRVPTLVDLSHDLEPGDLDAASHLLTAAAPTFPAGAVHLAVVDPGVGSERRILVVETPEARFVAPDNGLLTPFLDRASAVRSVTREELFLPAPGSTFHGRDRFAPVAAALLRGEEPAGLGPQIADPVRRDRPAPKRRDAALEGRVVHVDRFGNLITDLPTEWLPADRPFTATVAGHSTGRRVDHFSQLRPGEAGVLPGSRGTLEMSLDRASLAESWGVGRGQRVLIKLE